MKIGQFIQREFANLTLARKLVLATALFSVLFLFFPWGSRGVKGDGYEFISESFNAFGVFGIFGWLLLLSSVAAILLLLREVLRKKTHYRGMGNAFLWILLGSIGVYTILIALFVLNSAYLKGFDSHFTTKIGVFLTLFAQGLLVFAGVLGSKDDRKNYLKQTLSIDPHQAGLEPEPPEDTQQMSLGDYDH